MIDYTFSPRGKLTTHSGLFNQVIHYHPVKRDLFSLIQFQADYGKLIETETSADIYVDNKNITSSSTFDDFYGFGSSITAILDEIKQYSSPSFRIVINTIVKQSYVLVIPNDRLPTVCHIPKNWILDEEFSSEYIQEFYSTPFNDRDFDKNPYSKNVVTLDKFVSYDSANKDLSHIKKFCQEYDLNFDNYVKEYKEAGLC